MTNPFDTFDLGAEPGDDGLTLRQEFEDHAANVLRLRGLPRPEAERAAYAIVLTEFLNRTHPDTPADRCAWCGQGDDLRPLGWGAHHVWTHDACWKPWFDQRQVEAEEDLARLGVVRPPPEEPVEPAEPAVGAEPPEAAKSEPAEPPEADLARPEPLETAKPKPEPRFDYRARASIIAWDLNYCLGCRQRILIGQTWTAVSGNDGATARFHTGPERDCLDEWIAALTKEANP